MIQSMITSARYPDDRYINQDGKGLENHTDKFMDGYHNGFDAYSGNVLTVRDITDSKFI